MDSSFMTKVVFVTGSQARTGGTERVCADISNYLSEIKGYEVTILSLFEGKSSGFPVGSKVFLDEISTEKMNGYLNNLYFSAKLVEYVIKHKPDILIAVESLIFLNMLPITILPHRPKLVCWEHFNLDVNLGVRLRDKARYLATIFADKIVVLSEEDEKNWKKNFKNNAEKISHIYNPNPFANIEDQTINPNQKQKVVLSVGRLTYQKGFDLLLESWALLPDALRSEWTLKIAGEGEDRSKLEQMIIDHELSDSVRLLGYDKNIAKEYSLASIFTLSSRFEGFGLVLLEALSYKLPVISYRCPAGPSEIISDNVNGYLIDNGDFKIFAQKLKFLMENPEVLNSMRENTSCNINRFSSELITNDWHSLIRELTY